MEGVAYRQFLELERDHWWFQGRRGNYFTILGHYLNGRTDLDIVDVGCGVGGMLPELARFGRPIGVDADPGSVEICRERGFHHSFVGGGSELPLRSESHDLVTLFDCLEHLEDDEGALREVHRVLRPGGHAFFSVPAYQFLFSNNDRVAHHVRRYTRGELVRKARAAGLQVKKATYVNFVLFPVILPTLLMVKTKERLFPRVDDTRTNLSKPPPKWANSLLAGIFGGEGKLLKHVSMPFGHSLVMLVTRPD